MISTIWFRVRHHVVALVLAALVPFVAMAGETSDAPKVVVPPLQAGDFSRTPTGHDDGWPLGLAVALSDSAQGNPSVVAAFHRWQAACRGIRRSGALPDPVLSYRYFLESVETRVGAQRQALGIRQNFLAPGQRRSQRDRAEAEHIRAQYRWLATQWRVRNQVVKAWYELAYLSREERAIRDSDALLKQAEESLLSRLRTASVSQAQLIQLQTERGRLTDRLAALSSMRKALYTQLLTAIGDPKGTLPPSDWEERQFPTLSIKELEALVQERPPQLAAIEQEIVAAMAMVDEARSRGRPRVGLGLDYIDTDRRDVSMPDNGKDPVAAMVTISLPWDRGRVRADVEEKQHGVSAVSADLRDAEQQLQARLHMVHYHYQDAARRVGFYRKSLVPKAKQAAAAITQSYAASEATLTDLLEAQRTLLELELTADRAHLQQANALAQLEQITGRLLSKPKSAIAHEDSDATTLPMQRDPHE